ncbi:MAG: tape measure protein, partial [Arcobacteraceae bacterium]
VNESGNRLIRALSDSLGLNVKQLKDLGSQGKLTNDVLIKAFRQQSAVIDTEYTKTIETFAQSTQVATQNLTKFIGESTLVQSSVAAFGSAMVSVSGSIDEFTDAAIALAVVSIARVLPAMAKKEAAAISSTIASIGAAKADVTAAAATLRRAEAEKIAALAIVSTAKLDFQAAQNSNAYAFAKDNLARASSRAATAVGAYNAAAAASVAASARASIAARTLSGVMSLFGGPLGVALIAASALVYFYTTAETAEEKTKRLAGEIDQLAESFSGLNRIQRAVEISKINTEMSELRSQLIKANNQLNNWTEQLNSGNPFAAQKVQQFKSEVEGLNEQLDTLSTKQQAIFQGGLPEISTSPSATSPTGDGSGAVIADSEFQSKLEEETQQLRLNLQLRQAIRDEYITYDQARAIEVATNKLASQQATFDAEILKLGENEAAKAELLATFREAQKLAVAEFELSLTDIVSEESERRNQIKQREATQAIGTYSNYANAALSLESAFGSKSEKAQKRRRKAAVIIDTAAGIGRAFAENNFYVALGMSAAIAANGIAQIAAINSASSAPQSNVSAGGIPSDSAAAPSAPASSTVIDFRARPGQSFTADDVRDILGSVEGVTLINNGLENARRLGEI